MYSVCLYIYNYKARMHTCDLNWAWRLLETCPGQVLFYTAAEHAGPSAALLAA